MNSFHSSHSSPAQKRSFPFYGKFYWLPFILLFMGIFPIFSAGDPSQAAASDPQHILIAMGSSDYTAATGLIKAVYQNAHQKKVRILILPVALAEDPLRMSERERNAALQIAEQRRIDLESECARQAPSGSACEVLVAPVFTRIDTAAYDAQNLLAPELSAIWIIGDHAQSGIQVLGGTPLEGALNLAYEHGVIIAASGPASALQSLTMLGDFAPGFSSDQAVQFGAVSLLNSAEHHGLLFGTTLGMVVPDFSSAGLAGLMLNALTLPETPHIGIGIESETGLSILDGSQLADAFGTSFVSLFDAETYHASAAARYQGERYTISLRNVLFHTLGPGDYRYDLAGRQHSLAAPPKNIDRSFESLALPQGAGALILMGKLQPAAEPHPALMRFLELAGGSNASLQIVAIGYPETTTSLEQTRLLEGAFGFPLQAQNLPSGFSEPIDVLPEASGIVLLSATSVGITPAAIAPVQRAWQQGMPVLAMDAAAQAFGAYFSTPSQDSPLTVATGQDPSALKAGFQFIPTTIETDILAPERWRQAVSLAVQAPEMILLGLSYSSGIEFSEVGTIVLGPGPVIALDLRQAAFAEGSSQSPVIANGLVDVFAPGESLQPAPAAIDSSPERQPTPVLKTPTPTLTATATPLLTETPTPESPPPTRAPRPTSTPPIIPPAADANTNNLMALLGALAVSIILFGILLNRRRQF